MLYAIICWNVASGFRFIYLPWAVSFSILWDWIKAVALTNIPVAGNKKKILWHIYFMFAPGAFLGSTDENRSSVKISRLKICMTGGGESGSSACHIYLYWKHNTPFACTVSISLLSVPFDSVHFDFIPFFGYFFRLARDKTQLMPALKFTLLG